MSPKNGDIELDVVSTGSTDKQDDLALARLGKKAVLKVCMKNYVSLEKRSTT